MVFSVWRKMYNGFRCLSSERYMHSQNFVCYFLSSGSKDNTCRIWRWSCQESSTADVSFCHQMHFCTAQNMDIICIVHCFEKYHLAVLSFLLCPLPDTVRCLFTLISTSKLCCCFPKAVSQWDIVHHGSIFGGWSSSFTYTEVHLLMNAFYQAVVDRSLDCYANELLTLFFANGHARNILTYMIFLPLLIE